MNQIKLFKISLLLIIGLYNVQSKATVLEIDFSQVHTAQFPNKKINPILFNTNYSFSIKENYTSKGSVIIYFICLGSTLHKFTYYYVITFYNFWKMIFLK